MLTSGSIVRAGFMGLRDDASGPSTFVRYLELMERGGGREDRSLLWLTGDVLRRLDDRKKRRLISLALSHHRKVRTVRGPLHGLHAFITLVAPQERLIVGGMALVDANVRSYARIRARKNDAVLLASGTEWAERRLSSLIDEWVRRGSPTLQQLKVRATYRKTPPRAWRNDRRGDGWLSFDWAKSPN